MEITPVSFRNFSVQQNTNVSDLSFKKREERKNRGFVKRTVNAFKPLSRNNVSLDSSDNNKRRNFAERFANAFKPLPHSDAKISVIRDSNAKRLEEEGFTKIGECSLNILGREVKGATFVKESKDALGSMINVQVTDDMFNSKVEAYATIIKPDVATVGFHNVNILMPKLRERAYDALFKYIKDKHPEVKTAETSLNKNHDGDLYNFHTRYGFEAYQATSGLKKRLVYTIR